MASVVISGDTSGSVTLSAPAVANTTTQTLQATTGTVALTSDVIGVGQTWQDLTASRALATTYTNSSGKPIFVSVYTITGTSAGTITFTIDGIAIGRQGISAGASCTMRLNVTFIVPNNSTYNVQSASGTNTLVTWAELR